MPTHKSSDYKLSTDKYYVSHLNTLRFTPSENSNGVKRKMTVLGYE